MITPIINLLNNPATLPTLLPFLHTHQILKLTIIRRRSGFRSSCGSRSSSGSGSSPSSRPLPRSLLPRRRWCFHSPSRSRGPNTTLPTRVNSLPTAGAGRRVALPPQLQVPVVSCRRKASPGNVVLGEPTAVSSVSDAVVAIVGAAARRPPRPLAQRNFNEVA